jgi:hypothetical protein
VADGEAALACAAAMAAAEARHAADAIKLPAARWGAVLGAMLRAAGLQQGAGAATGSAASASSRNGRLRVLTKYRDLRRACAQGDVPAVELWMRQAADGRLWEGGD